MTKKKTNLQRLLVLLVMSFVWLAQSASAQTVTSSQKPTGHVNTNTKIVYHNGLIMTGPADVYLIWYGCWDNTCGTKGDTITQSITTDFVSNIGGSPWAQILRMYPNTDGFIPWSTVFLGASVVDQYSRGLELTPSDINGIITDQITNRRIPQDPSGIYVLIASTDVSAPWTGLCDASAQPYHGTGEAFGSDFRYAFLGNPNACPSVAAPQFVSNGNQLATPNGSLAGDALVNNLAHVLSTTITNPTFGAWFDRYGLQNADKCTDEFGTTYLTPNGARANMKLGQRDYLIHANWVNDRKGYCALSPPVLL